MSAFYHALRDLGSFPPAERISLDPAAIIHLLEPARAIPDGNGARITGVLSRSNELPNVFLDRTRWLESLQENSL